ncbi:TPA: hypothetical protein DF272_06785 [Candidatus Falkowbacteria bacterium]|nr:hypothetical protein [Candidatus Falkowbacteria bacterium]
MTPDEEESNHYQLITDRSKHHAIIDDVSQACAWILPFLRLRPEQLKRKRDIMTFEDDRINELGKLCRALVFRTRKHVIVLISVSLMSERPSGENAFFTEAHISDRFLCPLDFSEFSNPEELRDIKEFGRISIFFEGSYLPEVIINIRSLSIHDKFGWSLLQYLKRLKKTR